MGAKARTHRDLEVYRTAFDAARAIFEHSKQFPSEERFSLTDQIRRSSRSACANLAEAWRKRRYEKAFVSKLNEVEAELAETQFWLEFAVKRGYLTASAARPIYGKHDRIIGIVVGMIRHPETWILNRASRKD